jgi:transcriptional regulator with XRE-family HTH domain
VENDQNSNTWREALGGNIREAREQAGLTRDQLAEQVGKHLNTVRNWETGRIVPSVEILGDLASRINMKTDLNVNGSQVSIKRRSDPTSGDLKRQLELDFDKPYVYSGATLTITPSKLTITINAVAPMPFEPMASQQAGTQEKAS